MNNFIFSDLTHVLSYLAHDEALFIVPSSFFDWSKEKFTIRTNLSKKWLTFDSSRGIIDETKIEERLFIKSHIYLGSKSLELFLSEASKFTTFDRLIDFLDRIGLIYRPDLNLPANHENGYTVGEVVYFPTEVMVSSDRTKSVYGYNPSLFVASNFRVKNA